MILDKIKELLQAEVLTGEAYLERDVTSVMASDLMSDVLSFCCPQAILITGLTNPQAVRTAEVADLSAVVFTRGKRPSNEIIQMAKKRDVPLFTTKLPMYEACGILYTHGISSI